MLEALGGDAWLNRKNVRELGHVARFFQGAPTGIVIDFTETRQFANGDRPDASASASSPTRASSSPEKKSTSSRSGPATHGHEVTYKGNTTLPRDQVEDYYRRQDHSIESIFRVWLKAPGVIVLDEGSTMVERRLTERVSVLSADNDAVTLDIDSDTHLPRRRTFEWRNATFKDNDEDAEEYDDYHTIQGLPTAVHRHPLPQRRHEQPDLPQQSRVRRRHTPCNLRPQRSPAKEKIKAARINAVALVLSHLF